ncbi:MAG: hypothetical protein RQ745_06645 [Longimicrobiales bacterium]|nr:hypothetical protein [Longimicrobiales bacterium]
MQKAIEELITDELDTLYRGALFLCGGDGTRAEDLLQRTAAAAYRSGVGGGGSDDPHPLERLMVQQFVRDAGRPAPMGPSTPVERPAQPASFGTMTPDRLHRAAARLPALARAALWLILLRRWSYADAARALGMDRDGLLTTLLWRDAFVAALVQTGGSSTRSAAE